MASRPPRGGWPHRRTGHPPRKHAWKPAWARVGIAGSLRKSPSSSPAVRPTAAICAIVARIPAQSAHFAHQLVWRRIRQRDDFGVHHRSRKAARDHHVAEVMHVDKRHRPKIWQRFGSRSAQFLQCVRAETAEHQQAIGFQHPLPFGEDGCGSGCQCSIKFENTRSTLSSAIGNLHHRPPRDATTCRAASALPARALRQYRLL